MSTDRAVGKVKELVGQGEEALGDALDDVGLKARGVAHQVQGRVQGAVGTFSDGIDCVADSIETTVRRHPIASVLTVAAVGYLLGRLRSSFDR